MYVVIMRVCQHKKFFVRYKNNKDNIVRVDKNKNILVSAWEITNLNDRSMKSHFFIVTVIEQFSLLLNAGVK